MHFLGTFLTERAPRRSLFFKNAKHMFDIFEQMFYTGDIKIKRP